MKDRRLDILYMNETKRKGIDRVIKRGSFDTYWSSIDQSQRGCRGVGFVISERFSECVSSYECVSPRLLWLGVKIELTRIFIVGVYPPDKSKPLEERKEF
ncbi:hypothetical protein EVAR_3111_1 [Eumeta japonica]|uniref:Craniofacial development protein 2 n=1 Tax=Eumeta variegata TaxID=151549 RepID=A0A4C1XJD6_EUMVA|nr:hypothetical protein EVAR_3111_1 [Eumeta japonica]